MKSKKKKWSARKKIQGKVHGVTVIAKNPSDNPCCPHGPTIMFSKKIKDETKNFYACSAQRDRKFCRFYLEEGNQPKSFVKQEILSFKRGINHRKMFLTANELTFLKASERIYCSSCCTFVLNKQESEHLDHKVMRGLSDAQLQNPTEILPPAEHNKSEAQYWFSKKSVETIAEILKSLNYRNVICIGTPRIHEYIRNNCINMTSILLDFDKRFHSFFGPLEFCWYNLFNNYFFFEEAKTVFRDFLQMDNGDNIVIITDPPFGGRTEPIALTFQTINEIYQKLNQRNDNIPMFWIYPYFMETHICLTNLGFTMLDYIVEYENHGSFGNGPKARKLGSPVRIFTTVNPSAIKLPANQGYRYCKKCVRWVSQKNNHCDICHACTSKDGSTYVHCSKCERCVKPSWVHCEKCKRCQLNDHHCNGTSSEMVCRSLSHKIHVFTKNRTVVSTKRKTVDQSVGHSKKIKKHKKNLLVTRQISQE